MNYELKEVGHSSFIIHNSAFSLTFLVQLYYSIEVGSLSQVKVCLGSMATNMRMKSNCAMTKHYILSLNPTAKHDWDRCILRDPLTAKRPEIAKLISEAIGAEPGTYLVSVNIEVKVLEQAPTQQAEQLPLTAAVSPAHSHIQELVA